MVNGVCQYTQVTCPTGSSLVNGICTQTVYMTQTCWDGSVIPTTSICPTQYKVCSNGTTVFVGQSCPIIVTPTPVLPTPVIKFNNVVTSVATDITNNSGRCRGIGLIANSAQSTGWFEYGETSSLGRTTAQANIGSSATSPFSNLLANLKPNTTYFCRAVMQNQYGLVKGEIVSFTTKSKAVVYTAPVVTKKITKKPVVVKKNEITCSDGSVITVKSESSATLINSGKKLVTLEMQKASGTLTPEGTALYKATYKNLSDTELSNVLIQVTLPEEIVFVSSNDGTYDPTTRILTINKTTIDPYEENTVTWTAKIAKGSHVGKSVVTTGYMSYIVPGTQVTDEVTSYTVSTITGTSTNVSNQSNDTTHTSDRGFLPDTLIEWLALIAILFIIFILGRSMYISYHQKEEVEGR